MFKVYSDFDTLVLGWYLWTGSTLYLFSWHIILDSNVHTLFLISTIDEHANKNEDTSQHFILTNLSNFVTFMPKD